MSEPLESQRSAPVATLFPKPPVALFTPELSVKQFCQLQLTALLHQLAPSIVLLQLSYSAGDSRQTLNCCSPNWTADTAVETFLRSWQPPLHLPGQMVAIATLDQRQFYYCPIMGTDYLVIGLTQAISEAQQSAIAMTAQLLRHHLESVRELQQQHHQMQRMQHQLRTPIALAQLYTDLLLHQTGTGTSPVPLCQIQDALQDIRLHVDQLSQPAIAPVLQLGNHNLQTIVCTSIKGLQPWLNAKQLTVQHPGTSVILEVDAWQLRQVFDNLLMNAIHYSPAASTIGCAWQVFQREILVELWDQGTGLSEADLQHLFTPYYSRRPDGTGLGLAIAQSIVQAHCGRLWANNRLGGGAKFSFTLPRRYS